MTVPTGRLCALCGRPGGEPQSLRIKSFRQAGVKLREPLSNYAHKQCLDRANKKLHSQGNPT